MYGFKPNIGLLLVYLVLIGLQTQAPFSKLVANSLIPHQDMWYNIQLSNVMCIKEQL